MKYDEFAFFNQQLAAMLRDGVPLEGALRQLSTGMQAGALREEIELLQRDLAQGTPLRAAMERRNLPEFYRRMVEVGARSQDLPGVLTMLADHYHRANALWTRLKGLMVYPLLVILVSLGLTLGLSFVVGHFLKTVFEEFRLPSGLLAGLWLPPIVFSVLALLGLGATLLPSWRRRLRWKLPAFREASLANLGSALALMLKNGTPLSEALALAEALENHTPAAPVLAHWRRQVESGQGKPQQWTNGEGVFPPLFLWLVQKGGEDVAAGFQKAAELYRTRANYRIELALYGALPISMLFLGQMLIWQLVPLFQSMGRLMNLIGDVGVGS